MLFFLLINADIQFTETQELNLRNYTGAKASRTKKRKELIDKREFAAALLDKKAQIFEVYRAALLAMSIYPSIVAQTGALIAQKVYTKISTEYLN